MLHADPIEHPVLGVDHSGRYTSIDSTQACMITFLVCLTSADPFQPTSRTKITISKFFSTNLPDYHFVGVLNVPLFMRQVHQHFFQDDLTLRQPRTVDVCRKMQYRTPSLQWTTLPLRGLIYLKLRLFCRTLDTCNLSLFSRQSDRLVSRRPVAVIEAH